MTIGLSGVDASVAAALREPQRLATVRPDDVQALADAAARHGVAAVLLREAAGCGVSPDKLGEALRASASAEAATGAIRDAECLRMLGLLRQAGIPHVVIKGLALAYTVYARPWLRPRADTDVLVERGDLERVDGLFLQEGYTLFPHVRGDLILPQRQYVKVYGTGFQHNWDVHWRLTASHVLAHAPADEEVRASACEVQALGGSRASAAPHALMIACIHRLAHHYDHPRLIWLWDIRLLLGALSASQLSEFASLAARDPVTAAACGRSLAVARDLCGADIPALLTPLLQTTAGANRAAFLWSGSPRRASYLLGELRAMPGGKRLRVLRQHLVPSLSSMRERYPSAPRALLPLLYPWRLMVGMPKWLSGR